MKATYRLWTSRASLLLVSLFFAFSANSANVFFNACYIGAGAGYTQNTQTTSSITLVAGSGFSFTSANSGDPVFPTGNDAFGIFTYTPSGGSPVSMYGMISRKDKVGATLLSFYFLPTTDATFTVLTGQAYIFVVPGQESSYSNGMNVTTSSDNVVNALNALLAAQSVPTINLDITGSFGSFFSCAGAPSTPQTFNVSGQTLSTNILVSAPAGFELSLNAGGPYSSSLSLTPSAGVVPNTVIYARVTSGATNGAGGNITASSTGATTQSLATGSATVSPIPNVNPVTSAEYCNGANTSAINFSGAVAGTVYNWTNNTPSIGLAASGTGNIASFTATNTGTIPVTATITVTPATPAGGPDQQQTGTSFCMAAFSQTGLAQSFKPAASNICGASFYITAGSSGDITIQLYDQLPNNGGVVLAQGTVSGISGGQWAQVSWPTISVTPGTTYYLVPTSTNGGQCVAGEISDLYPDGQVYANSGYASFPTYDYSFKTFSCGTSCSGTPISFTITVNPTPDATATPASQTICSGAAITTIALTGNVAGTTYSWSRDNTASVTGISSAGSGNISGSLTNTTNTPVTVTFTITPSANGCTGTAITATVLVNPTPDATATPASQTICSGAAITTIALNGNVTGTTYSWTRDNTAAATGIAASGSGNVSGTLTNTTNTPVTVTFTITPSANGCTGSAITASIVVNPTPTVNSVSNQTVCNGASTGAISFSGAVTGTVYNWTNNTTSIGLGASGTGNINAFTALNSGTTPVTATITVTPSYTNAGSTCTGTPVTFTITVNPTPNAIATPATQTICSNTAMNVIALTGGVAGTSYSWTRTNTINVTGIPASGTGNISGTPVNNTTTQQLVTFTITPSANGCTGAPITATLNVNVAPTVTCPANITVNNDAGICGAIVTYPSASATGFPVPVITYSQASGSLFPVGTTVVTVTATNTCGTATCTFTVTVRDAQAPVIACPSNIVRNTDAASCVATVIVPNPVFSDNCIVTQLTWAMTGATTASSPATGINYIGTRSFNLNGTTGSGITTVTYTAKDAAGNTTTCSFTVTVNDAQKPVISSQPVTRFFCAGTTGSFSVNASTNGGPLAYQWQEWNGTAWVNIAGATTNPVTIANVSMSDNTRTFRVVLTGLCTVVNSDAAVLYVNPIPTVSIYTNASPAIVPMQTVDILSSVSLAGGSYTWYLNNTQIPGANGSILRGINVDKAGLYKMTYTDPNGCVATSQNTVDITAQASDKMFLYPNPNNGKFNVRVFNKPNEKLTLRIYDDKGALVYSQVSGTSLAYTDFPVDLTKNGFYPSAVYIVKVIGENGRVLGTQKVLARIN